MNLRVSATGLVKSHLGSGVARPHPALVDVHLEWAGGTLVVLTGPNGAGKTTLLRLLAGLDQPDGGHVFLDQDPVPALPETLRSRGAWLPDRPGFPAGMSARSCLEEVLILDGVPTSIHGPRLHECAQHFDLDSFWTRPGPSVSRGQQALLSLARLSLLDRDFWWLDEPFAALDSSAINRVCSWMEGRLLKGNLVVLCTHQADGGAVSSRSWDVPVHSWVMDRGRMEKQP